MEILVNTFIKAAGWSIIHALWQGAVIYIILLMILMSGSGMKAKTKYAFSYLALCIMFFWFMQTFLSEFLFRMQQQNSTGFDVTSAAFSNTPPEILTLSSSLLEITERNFPLIVLLYGAGLVVQSAFLLLGYYRIRQLKSTGLSELPSTLQNTFAGLMDKMGLKRQVRFRLSSRVNVPLVIGYFKPLILLPLSVLSHLDPKQLEAVIIHELAHIRRNDYLLNLLKVTIETILFFSPFVWLCSRLAETEREYACDDHVLQLTGEPLVYAHTLMKIEHLKIDHHTFALAITGKKFHLLNRIRRMTGMKTNTLNFKIRFLAMLFISSVLFSVAWIPVKKTAGLTEKSEINNHLDSTARQLVISFRSVPADRQTENIRIGHTILQNDTTKRMFKIVFENERGEQKIYNSLEEMPADLRADFSNGNRSGKYSPPVYHFGKEFNGFISKFNKDTTVFRNMGMDSLLFKSDKINFRKDSARLNLKFFKSGSSFWFNSVKQGTDSIYRSIALSEVTVTAAPLFQTEAKLKNEEILLRQNKELLQKQGENLLKGMKESTGKQENIFMNRLNSPDNNKHNQPNHKKVNPIKQDNKLIIKILENPENRNKLESFLKKRSYTMNPDGRLEENTDDRYNFDEGIIKKSDILRVIVPGTENKYGIYIPTRQERLRNLVSNPANQDKLNKIMNGIPFSPDLVMNNHIVYTFDEGLFQKGDIIEYLDKSKKTR